MTDTISLPEPACELGYTEEQILELFGTVGTPRFKSWMWGQTVGVCNGERFDFDTREYQERCEGTSHGSIYYKWDVQRYIDQRPIVD